MRKFVSTLLLTGVLVLGSAGAAFAHDAGPCNDTDGDGAPSGREYAEHHIVAAAQAGDLGNEDSSGEAGHKPGSHQGFSACNPSGR